MNYSAYSRAWVTGLYIPKLSTIFSPICPRSARPVFGLDVRFWLKADAPVARRACWRRMRVWPASCTRSAIGRWNDERLVRLVTRRFSHCLLSPRVVAARPRSIERGLAPLRKGAWAHAVRLLRGARQRKVSPKGAFTSISNPWLSEAVAARRQGPLGDAGECSRLSALAASYSAPVTRDNGRASPDDTNTRGLYMPDRYVRHRPNTSDSANSAIDS